MNQVIPLVIQESVLAASALPQIPQLHSRRAREHCRSLQPRNLRRLLAISRFLSPSRYMKKRLAFAVGGTGGHLFPAQALASSLEADFDIAFFGHGLKTSPFFQRGNIPFYSVEASPLQRGFLRKSARGFLQGLRALRKFSPDGVIGFGSFHTFPVLAAAVCLRKKIALVEANQVMGKVNRLFRPFADAVWSRFPLPKEAPLPSRLEALSHFGLDPAKRTLLVFGGSQGASFFNETLPKVSLSDEWQVLHLTGKEGKAEYPRGARVQPFEPNMPMAYAAADCVVCRAGAATIGELVWFQKPALLVPFPQAADDHQTQNALFLKERGGGRVALQKEASPLFLEKELSLLLEEKEKYAAALALLKEEWRAQKSIREEVLEWMEKQ